MRSLASLGLLLVLILIPAVPAAAQQQQQPFGEKIDVTAVLLDVVVTDDRGNQILGLEKDDFVVKENGVKQAIDSVDYYTSRRLLTNPEETLPFKVEQIKEERYLIFFFDKPEGAALFDQIARARRSVEEFVDRDMGGNDQVAIVGHDVRLKVYTDFTSDKRRVKKALGEAASFSNGLTKPGNDPGPSILHNINLKDMMGDTGTVYEAIDYLADSVRSIKGRKNLVIFSAGIIEPGEETRGGVLLNTSRYYQPMIDSLNAANVTVFAANLLQNTGAMAPVFHQTLERMTSSTNGDYFRNAVSFDPVLEQVEKSSGGYYLITYRANKPRGAKGFQKVEVDVKNPEFRVKSRAGYLYGEGVVRRTRSPGARCASFHSSDESTVIGWR